MIPDCLGILSASSVVSCTYYEQLRKQKTDTVIISQFLVRFGDYFTIEDLTCAGDGRKSNLIINHQPILMFAPRLVGRKFIKQFLVELRDAQGLNARADYIEFFIRKNIHTISYAYEEVVFYRIDKYSLYSSTIFYTNMNRLRPLSTEKTISNFEYSTHIPLHLADIGVSKNTYDAWVQINSIEPQLRPSHILLDTMIIENNTSYNELSDLCDDLYQQLEYTESEHLVLLPHVQTGGADKAAETLIRFLSKQGRVIVVTTEPTSENTQANSIRAMKNVQLLELNKQFKRYNRQTQIDVIRILIGIIKPKTIDLINSQSAYLLATSTYRQIGYNSRYYVHAYAYVYEEGYKIPPFHNGIADIYPYVTSYITDSFVFKRELSTLYGIAPKLIEAVYIPQSTDIQIKSDYSTKNRILWIGRIAREKLFKEVMVIARKLYHSHGTIIEVWGPIDENYVSSEEVKGAPGIQYCGIYTDINQLDFNAYDMLLFTTLNEGVPNVLVETVRAGLYVVAPSVGGIPEILRFGETASLVDNPSDIQKYIQAIEYTYSQRIYTSKEQLHQASQAITQQHSYQAYKESMTNARKK